MLNRITTILRDIYRRHARVAAYVVFGVCVSFFCFALVAVFEPYRFLPEALDSEALPSEIHELSASEPARLRIPKVSIDATFEAPLGLKKDRTIEVPKEFTTVGWYKYGPTPGELGPAVILGHVDSWQGPAVLHPLKNIVPGDHVFIDREDGSVAEFVVERLERYSQDEFPTEAVYGDIGYAGLRIITCTGTYDHGTLRYSHNLVVYARLVESE